MVEPRSRKKVVVVRNTFLHVNDVDRHVALPRSQSDSSFTTSSSTPASLSRSTDGSVAEKREGEKSVRDPQDKKGHVVYSDAEEYTSEQSYQGHNKNGSEGRGYLHGPGFMDESGLFHPEDYEAKISSHVGSQLHDLGQCKPCGYFWRGRCADAWGCTYCHICTFKDFQDRRKDRKRHAKNLGGLSKKEHQRQLREAGLPTDTSSLPASCHALPPSCVIESADTQLQADGEPQATSEEASSEVYAQARAEIKQLTSSEYHQLRAEMQERHRAAEAHEPRTAGKGHGGLHGVLNEVGDSNRTCQPLARDGRQDQGNQPDVSKRGTRISL